MEEDSLLCLPLRKTRPSWAIGLTQHHNIPSLTSEEKNILDRQLGIIKSLKSLSKEAIKTTLNKHTIETTLEELTQQLPLPKVLKEYISQN